MATIQEVANRAGVSKATVSRVLSGNGYVGKEKREKVLKAIAETGYRPNCWRATWRQKRLRPLDW